KKTANKSTYASVAIACINQEQSGRRQALAQKLRDNNIPCEVFIEGSGDALVKQYVTAEKRGIRWMIVPEGDPLSGSLVLRDIKERKNRKGLSVEEIAIIIGEQ
ncbi:MAG: His/Gly/Thr/Pro-type tRNA ligase C-terminal domain-containing protein, partial [Treponema sp.]|nr:His/Gly/Thr/Pro-type tRNA ligase C-terminal domain-containing protein [Treponema sp.]